MSYIKKYRKKFSMFQVILEKKDPVIIEIGAHYGEDTLRFLECFPESKIYCFEPDPRNINIFKKYVKHKNVELFELALSDSKGRAQFFQSYQEYNQTEVPDKYNWISLEDYKKQKLNNSGSSSLKKGYKHTLATALEVKTDRFDNWYNENSPGEIDLVWIDVQGAEKDVLAGMGDAIKNIKFIWTEYGETGYEDAMTRIDTINFMFERGFEPIEQLSSRMPAGDILFRRKK